MLFGKRDKKKPNDRVLDLKARVDALRAADESTRQKPYSLEHFLEGDDVLTGRAVEDDYTPSGFDATAGSEPVARPEPDNHFEVNLQAELEKYIRRQEELRRGLELEDPLFESAEAERPMTSSNWSEPAGLVRAAEDAPVRPSDVWQWSSGGEAPSSEPARDAAERPEAKPPPEDRWLPREDKAV